MKLCLFRGRQATLVARQFSLRIFPDDMIRGPTASGTEPFFGMRIPTKILVSHNLRPGMGSSSFVWGHVHVIRCKHGKGLDSLGVVTVPLPSKSWPWLKDWLASIPPETPYSKWSRCQ
jgi:hypothetical protein